ncbi:FAD-binding oxidoreductase [Aeromicrobium sp. CTD01-1L150]|uniref:FAD-binding oxidoreductase n=1 Tax=Aeromicrobium sp. CTD01-1L150 TaxID=3341830 RepID=UPI0035C20718
MTSEMHPSRWGDPTMAGELPESTRDLVEIALGIQETPAVGEVSLPPSRLQPGLLDELAQLLGAEHVLTDDEQRRLRTRGKSTPDLLKARAGDLSDAPDAVVRPGSHADVENLISFAVRHHVALVPFGGGTCVTGGLAARREGYAGLLSVDLVRLKALRDVDRRSMTAVLEPGLRGPEAEALLAEHGLVLGHYPQSFEYASIGGFAATRSSGQASAGYGRFDAMVVGLTVATPQGTLDLGSSPANAAGPDLRQLVLGSEGTFGIITAVRVRVKELPAEKVYEAWQFGSFAKGADAMRHLAQNNLMPTVLRLSDEAETALNLASQSDVGGEANSGCLMIVGHEGPADASATGSVVGRRALVADALTRLGGVSLGEERGTAWAEGRFHAPYLRDSLLDVGVLAETLETATFWADRERVYTAVRDALTHELGEQTIVLCHISHVYETGCSLYFTVATGQDEDPLGRWAAAKAAASQAMIDAGATITHHHAVGTDHLPWFAQEIGPVGVSILRSVKDGLDPTGVLNPGVMIP